MAKHVIEGWLYQRQFQWEDEPTITFSSFDRGNDSDYALIRPYSFEVEVPDDFDPRPAMIVALERKKQEVRAEFARTVAEIDKRIGELQAITMKE